MELMAAVILLGVASLDFSGAMIILTALTLGAKNKDVCTFALINLIGTVAIGVVCACLLGENIEHLTGWASSVGVVLELFVACLLMVWFARRVLIGRKKDKKEDNNFLKKYLDKGLFSVGVGFSIGALTDPSFIALITFAGYNMHFIEIILANCVWILISQLPAFALTIAVILGKYEQMVTYVQKKMMEYSWLEKLKLVLPKLLMVIILIVALLLFADGLVYLVSENRLMPII